MSSRTFSKLKATIWLVAIAGAAPSWAVNKCTSADGMGLGDTGDLAPVIGRCADHMARDGRATKDVFQVWRALAGNPGHYLAPGYGWGRPSHCLLL